MVDTKLRLFEEHVLGFRLQARVTDYIEDATKGKMDGLRNEMNEG